ncbi:hypothetical protein KPSA1_07046 [Pseudomonas syringae pv. actinidiae]|uniref:Uncharacterized protein n=1 Tax=Pseudomonas syringae pv. actinidiae TaxID=103796 RepID=A0A2V0QKA2_PSESF|nr:hypothetical protein KPSA1_07046 [Pseudomonas syringae pv. actinidiae]
MRLFFPEKTRAYEKKFSSRPKKNLLLASNPTQPMEGPT